jgi:ABC-type multidrug transport system fused ATPase/permease subunit
VDISRLELFELRSHLAIIPQDPVLFVGSLLSNLDPFGEYSLERLKEICERIQLNIPLTEPVTAGGGNLSVGERQLVCIGRALLRSAKVLVLDEATANIDTRTDTVLQQVMRKEFGQATVLIVAHRLNTVIDCDRILVLEAGRIEEFDAPGSLVRRETSKFRSLLNDTGVRSARHLTGRAIASQQSKMLLLQEQEDEGEEEDEFQFIATDFAMREFHF